MQKKWMMWLSAMTAVLLAVLPACLAEADACPGYKSGMKLDLVRIRPRNQSAPTEITVTPIKGSKGMNSREEFTNLFDQDLSTKWCLNIGSKPVYAMWKTSQAICTTGYIIGTGNDNNYWTGRNPASWTLYGCNHEPSGKDDPDWDVIQIVIGDRTLQDVNQQTYEFTLDKAAPSYQYFKLEVSKTRGGKSCMQISEFALKFEGMQEYTFANVGGGSTSSGSSGSSGSGSSSGHERCRYCDGTGRRPCSFCNGKGTNYRSRQGYITCTSCSGAKTTPCAYCGGDGYR